MDDSSYSFSLEISSGRVMPPYCSISSSGMVLFSRFISLSSQLLSAYR